MEEEKTIVMPLVTSSENGIEQTESLLEINREMWCCKIQNIYGGLLLSLFNYCWNTLTVEGDSPVDFGVIWSFFLNS